MEQQTLFVGTYTRTGESKGIYKLSLTDRNLTILATTNIEVNNPTYLLQDGENIYTCESNGDGSGGVAGYTLKDNEFTFKNKVITPATGPCHVALDATKKYLAASHYHAGKVDIHEVAEGFILEHVQTVDHKQFEDESHPTSHVHFADFTKDNKYLVVCDLGLDQIVLYPFDETTGKLNESAKSIYQTKLEDGPRHFTWNKTGDILYVLNELSGSLLTLAYADGKLERLAEHEPANIYGREHMISLGGAAIRLHPSGTYLYTTLRATHNVVLAYVLDDAGIPTFIDAFSSEGNHPRDFNITNDGKYLVVGNQFTGNITVYEIAADGKLINPDSSFELPQAVCFVNQSV